MEDNWYVLCLSIFKNLTVEQAFNAWEGCKPNNNSITADDVEDMKKMRLERLSYKAIGEIYGISETAAYRRINGYGQYKKNRSTAMVAAS